MSSTMVEVHICDRCGNAFRRNVSAFKRTACTTLIGWRILSNGSYSGSGNPNASSDAADGLDHDFCEPCTEAFEEFMAEEKVAEADRVTPATIVAEMEQMAKRAAAEEAEARKGKSKKYGLPPYDADAQTWPLSY